MVRFDAYTATSQEAKPEDFAGLLLQSSGLAFNNIKLRQTKGFHQFGERLSFADETGQEFGAVMWGGKQEGRVLIEVKGDRTQKAVEALRSRFPHRCTRVDSCADFDAPGAFERLYRGCVKVKRDHRIIGGKSGDWEDFPEKGRTLYLGAKTSVARVRLYEKGKQPEYEHLGRLDWVRLEVQVRPAKEAKEAFSELSPLDVWGASRWTRELAAELLEQHIDPHPAGTVYRLPSDERALKYVCKQYGPMFARLAMQAGGWEHVGLRIRDQLEENKRRKV